MWVKVLSMLVSSGFWLTSSTSIMTSFMSCKLDIYRGFICHVFKKNLIAFEITQKRRLQSKRCFLETILSPQTSTIDNKKEALGLSSIVVLKEIMLLFTLF